MELDEALKFSIVIPTYNEEKEIFATLAALEKLDYQNKEIIVIDDSTDNTSAIIRSRFSESVTLIKPTMRKGRCEARNIGIREATGDILIILNADVILPVDFIRKIKFHYEQGYDSVTVMADVKNQSSCYARYVDALSVKKEKLGIYNKRKITHQGLYWSEGFSVRRDLALKTKLFPSGHSVPIEAGEDVEFVNLLRTNGCIGKIDDKLRIEHIAPDNLLKFWIVRKGRGAGTPQIRLFINNWTYKKVFFIISAKLLIRFLLIVLLIPTISYGYRLSRYSKKKSFFEVVKFSFCAGIEQIAFTVGEFESYTKIIMKKKL